MVCCHVCFHKTKPEASYVRALRRDCTHSARTLPARTLPLLLFTEVPRRGVLRASPARSFSEVSREQRLGAFARRTEQGRAPNLKGYPYSGRDRAGAGTRPHLTRHADERFTTRPRRRPIHRSSGKRRSLDLASDGFSELRLYRVLGTSVARLFPAVLGGQRAGTPKETGAPCGRPRPEGAPSRRRAFCVWGRSLLRSAAPQDDPQRRQAGSYQPGCGRPSDRRDGRTAG